MTSQDGTRVAVERVPARRQIASAKLRNWPTAGPASASIPRWRRWWAYSEERFPLFAHGPVIAAFSFSTLCFSRLSRGVVSLPDVRTVLVAAISALIFFLQLRIADEFKDADEDALYRPYRAVPRGLVSLRELRAIALVGGLVQLCLALWLSPELLPLLLVTWAYLALMSAEFFMGPWLRRRPVTYMWTHMLILPFIDLYVSACDWRTDGGSPPGSLVLFLCLSFCNGFVLEVGRKIRAPKDEETGVPTYSALWGRTRAVSVWTATSIVTAMVALFAAYGQGFAAPAATVLFIAVAAMIAAAARFLLKPTQVRSQAIERASGLWTLVLYLTVGAAPLLSRAV